MNWGVAVPVIAFILASIAILGLWYWWSSNQEAPPGEGPAAPPSSQPPAAQGWTSAIAFEMGLFRRFVSSLRSVLPQSSGQPASRSTVAPARQTGELVEAVRLFRDLATGGLVIEIGGKRYFSLAEMTDETTRRRFLGVAESVSQFAQGMAPEPVFAAPPPPTAAASSATSATPTAADAAKKDEKPVVKSMADEIEELLQYRLTLTPDMAQRSIHIRPAGDGGIQVEVDGRYYDGIGDIADETIKTFLQAIVREWEARQ